MSNVKGLTYTIAMCNIRKHLIRLSSVGSCPERLGMVSIICWRAQVYRILNYDEMERIFSGSYRHNPARQEESLGMSHLEGEVWSHFLSEEAMSARLIAQLGRPSHPRPERPWITCWVKTTGRGSVTDVLAGRTDLPSHVEPAPPGESLVWLFLLLRRLSTSGRVVYTLQPGGCNQPYSWQTTPSSIRWSLETEESAPLIQAFGGKWLK